MSQAVQIFFLKKQFTNMFNVKIYQDFYVYTSYVKCKVFKKISLGLTNITVKFYIIYLLIIKQILEQMDVAITSKVLIDKPKEIYVSISL